MLTFGVSVSRSSNLRPKIGVLLTVISSSVVLDSVLVVSIVGTAVMVTRLPLLRHSWKLASGSRFDPRSDPLVPPPKW